MGGFSFVHILVSIGVLGALAFLWWKFGEDHSGAPLGSPKGYFVVHGLAVVVGILFGVCLALGFIVIFNEEGPTASMVGTLLSDPASAGRVLQMTLGGVLVFVGVMGLLLSGLVRILIGIEANTRAMVTRKMASPAE